MTFEHVTAKNIGFLNTIGLILFFIPLLIWRIRRPRRRGSVGLMSINLIKTRY
jgi:hypothetical protein